MDIVRGEATEKELDALIRRRHDQRQQTEGERLEEELYEPSVRAWRERQEAGYKPPKSFICTHEVVSTVIPRQVPHLSGYFRWGPRLVEQSVRSRSV